MAETPLRLPGIDLSVEGNRLSERCAQSFTSLRVHQHLCRPSVSELCFSVADPTELQSVFRVGASLRIAVRGAGPTLFEGSVSAVELGYGSDRISTVAVRAYDSLLALRNRGSSRAFVGLTAADMARELTADLGLYVTCDEPGPIWPRLLQLGTDFELLLEATRRCGLYFSLQNGALCLHTLQGQGDALTLTLGDQLHEIRFEENSNGSIRRVAATGWDPWRGTEHAVEADSARTGHGSAPRWTSGGIGGADALTLPGRPVQGAAQALAFAQAELDASSSQALVMWATAAGDARLRPGVRVNAAGVAARLSGPHVLTSVRHTLDAEHGFRSEVSSALAALPPQPGGTLMTLGQVTRIDDPERIGRVQVAMLAYDSIESDWLQVVAAGAGKGKGVVVQPDVGDRVLLLIDRADPAQAVVLGSLYGEVGLPEDQGGLGKDASFCFVTPGGHRLRLDDGSRSIRLSGSEGSHLEMTPEGVKLHAAAPLTIEAPGQRVVIRARFIDFERA